MTQLRLTPRNAANQWLASRQQQVLDCAYAAAREIRVLEDKYGNGRPITAAAGISQTIYDYARSLCDRQLLKVRNNLTQFKINSFLLGSPPEEQSAGQFDPDGTAANIDADRTIDRTVAHTAASTTSAQGSTDRAVRPNLSNSITVPSVVVRVGKASLQENRNSHTNSLPNNPHNNAPNTSSSLIQKLSFIESVIAPYRDTYDPSPPTVIQRQPARTLSPDDPLPIDGPPDALEPGSAGTKDTDPALLQVEIAANDLARPGLFGSFSLNRKQTAQYEQKVVQELRLRRQQSRKALSWIVALIVVPLVIAALTKLFLLNPVLGSYSDTNPTAVQLSTEIREEFAAHLTEFKEELEIRELLGLSPELEPKVKKEQLAEKASELWKEARNEELNGLKNVLADSIATVVFIGLVYFNRRRLTVIRAFSNRAFLSLSDPVKIFLFILVTDMFVGFHSAEGWDAILSGVSHHFGLPERQNAIKIFIATVPVMMDSCIKFWIFNYLTRYSPASSAIFERMNS